tara:strand:- start:2693 stop:5245 length:2553 start_codon:yes stop_codon:yes gene_type:complete
MTHAVLAFGRMNPPTTGHEKFIKKTHEVAKKVGGKAHVVASHSEGSSKNPIPQKKKLEYIKKVAHKDVHVSGSSKEHPTILHQASKLHAAGHKHLHVVAAGEREKEFHDKLHQYNGKSGKHGHYHFKSITVHSSGKRDPDSHGTEGVSGTKMREHAHNNDHKSFKAGLPKALHPHKDEIMNHIKTQKEDLDQEFEELLEAMNIKQRIKRKLIMRRARPKINRMKRLYKKRKVPEKNLVQRSRKAGIRFVRKRVAGKKGTQYGKLSAAAKMHIDQKVAKQQKIVNNIAKRLLPRTRKAELVRLQKNEVETAFGDYIEERSKRKDGKAFEVKDTGTQAGNTKHAYKEKNKKGQMGAPVTEQDLHSLFLKSEKGEQPFEVILEVFVRGIEDWDGGSNSPAQYAFNRVNSFIAGGKAYEMDSDLVEDSSKRAADQTSNLSRKIGRKSETLRSKQSVSSKSTTLFKRRHGGKTSQHRQDTGMGRSSSAEGDVARTKRPRGGITKMHKDLKNYSEKDFRRVHGKSKSAARQALAKENFAMVSGATSMTQSKTPPPQRVKKDKAGNPYMKFEGTPEAVAHAKKVTPGEIGEAAPLPTKKATAGADKIKKNLLTKAIKRQMSEKMGMDANTDEVGAAAQKNGNGKMKGRIKIFMMPKVNVKEGNVNEAGFVNRKDTMPAGKELGKVMKDQGKTFFQGLNDRKARGVKSKPIDKDKFFGKKKVNEVSDKTLSSYGAKASDASKHRGLPTKKVDNRYSGVALAHDKLAKAGKLGTTAKRVSKAKVAATESLNLSFEQWLEAYSASYAKPVRAGTTSQMGAKRGKKPSSATFHASYQKPVVGDRKQLRDPMKKRKTEVSWS